MKPSKFTFLSVLGPLFLTLCVLSHAQSTERKSPLRLGALISLTGPLESMGAEAKKGLELAVAEINKSKLLSIEVSIEDDKSDPIVAAAAAKIMVDRRKSQMPHVVVGSITSTNTIAAAPILSTARIPLLTPSSTNVNVTSISEFVSRICFLDSFQGLAMARFAAIKKNWKTAAVIVDNSSDYSMGLAQAFRSEFAKQKAKVVLEASYIQGTTDFAGIIKRLKERNPEVVFVPGYFQEVALLLKQAHQAGIQSRFMGGDGWSSSKFFEIAGEAAIGHYHADHFSPDDSDQKVREFNQAFTAKYKSPPSAIAALWYDAVYVIADAHNRAATTAEARDPLMRAINGTSNFLGVTGRISLDERRNASKPISILQTQRERSTFVTRMSP